ncbi:MAG: hypothetical protein HY303_18255 [Candidatus Wallbacteria bacterium]|nr:hypothetical protein [Candidatus Wallbacteria bacterium]
MVKQAVSQDPAGYAQLLEEIGVRIRETRLRASIQVNHALLTLYWQIGRDILMRQQDEGWVPFQQLEVSDRRDRPIAGVCSQLVANVPSTPQHINQHIRIDAVPYRPRSLQRSRSARSVAQISSSAGSSAHAPQASMIPWRWLTASAGASKKVTITSQGAFSSTGSRSVTWEPV